MSVDLKELREALEGVLPLPWTWGYRRGDEHAPGSITSGAHTGRAHAVAMCPRYSRDRWEKDARAIVALMNAAPLLLDELAALRAIRRHADLLLRMVEDVPSKEFHAAFCNGVHAPDGQCEGELWASRAAEELREALRQEAQK